LPEGWCWATLEQLSDDNRAITYGVVKLGEPVVGGVPTLRSSNVRHLRFDLEGLKSISPTIANGYKRTFLQGSEILVTVRGTLGGVAVVPVDFTGYNISREVAMIACILPTLAPCLALFIGSPPIQSWMMRSTKGIAYTGINIETLKGAIIPLPPLAEQEQIVAEVEQHLSIVTQLEAIVEANLKRAERLRQSILNEAFAGRLVPQDPNDEPASVLLECIRKEREGQIKGAAGNGRYIKVSSEPVQIGVEGTQQVELWEGVGG
jgi:type I restriction enzyme, S subunit